MAQELVSKIRLDDKQFKSILDRVKSEVGNTETVFKSSSGNIKQELKAIQGELSNMLLNGVDPASEKFQQLAQRAGSIKDAMGDAKAVVGQFANDTRGLTAALDVAGTGVGIFQTVAGSLAMFGVESEETKETLTKLAGAMSVLNGITQLQNSFMDQSSGTYRAYHALLRLVGIEQANNTTAISANTVSQAANSSAITANTVATTGATVATEGLTVAQKASSVAAKGLRVALSAIGIGILISLVAALYQKFEDLTDSFKTTEGASSNMAQAWNKIKVIAVGVGNAIWEHMIYPLKMFAGIVIDFINGDWDKIISNAVQRFKGGHDLIGNYNYSANKELAKQNEEARERETKAKQKDLDDWYEAENAARGQSLSRDVIYHRKKLALFKKGSEEYRQESNKLKEAERRLREDSSKKSAKLAADQQRAEEKALKEAEAAARKRAEEERRRQEKIKSDQDSVKQTIETDHTTTTKNTRKTQEETVTYTYNQDKTNNLINSKGALDNQLKIIQDYYTKVEQFRQADYTSEVAAVNKKYDTLAEKAHGNKELLTQIEEERQAAINSLQEKYNLEYTKLLDQRAKDEKEASDKLLQPLLDKARQLGQELGRTLKLDGLDFSALEELNKNLEQSVKSMKELKTVQDNLSNFQDSGFTRMIEDAKALQQILGSSMASDGEKIGASMVFMSSALQQLGQDSAAAKAGLVLQAIGQIILGFAQASAQDSKLGVIGWVAAIAAGTAVMISTISQLQKFSQGGIFQGSSAVGDHNLARVNAGEMILTNTQQSNLFRLLDNNTAGLGGSVGVSSVRVKGSDLYLALSNYSKIQSKTGRRLL